MFFPLFFLLLLLLFFFLSLLFLSLKGNIHLFSPAVKTALQDLRSTMQVLLAFLCGLTVCVCVGRALCFCFFGADPWIPPPPSHFRPVLLPAQAT